MKINQEPKVPRTTNPLTLEEIEKVYKELGIHDEQEFKRYQELNKLAMSFEKNNQQPIISVLSTSTEEGQENGKLE